MNLPKPIPYTPINAPVIQSKVKSHSDEHSEGSLTNAPVIQRNPVYYRMTKDLPSKGNSLRKAVD